MIDICPICQIATPCDCDDHEETNVGKLMHAGAKLAMRIGELEAENDRLRAFVEGLASLPTPDENMHSTWCPPDYDILCEWWRDYVTTARMLTGVSYRHD